jgi:hypothetical protein
MNRSRKKVKTWARVAVWGTFAAVLTIGCNPLQLAGFIFARDEKIPAQYPLTHDKDGPKADKEEVAVALLVRTAPGAGQEFATADRELADRLSRRLPELAKENKKKLRVIPPAQVDKFKLQNPGWRQMEPSQIAEKLGADFVLDLWVDKIHLYQPGTPERIYEGRAVVTVSIYEAGPAAGFKDKYSLSVAFPTTGVYTAERMPESQFKSQFAQRIAEKIALQHIDYKRPFGLDDQ